LAKHFMHVGRTSRQDQQSVLVAKRLTLACQRITKTAFHSNNHYNFTSTLATYL